MVLISDNDLIKGIRENNEDAFRLLVERYQDMVFRTCYGFLKFKEDAEDVTQEVFIKVYRKIKEFRGDSELSTWLYRIAINMSINALRKNKRRMIFQSFEGLFNYSNSKITNGISYEPSTEEIFERKQKEMLINKAIHSLPLKQKTAFILHKYDELPQQEIAIIMQTSISAVESLIHRAKQSLQKKLISIKKEQE